MQFVDIFFIIVTFLKNIAYICNTKPNINVMKLKSLVAAIALIAAATSCVDKDFQIDKVSTEVAIGGDVTTLPLGYLEKQKLGEIIDLDTLEGLNIDADGNYSLAFNGDRGQISIDGIDNKYEINKTITTFSTEYPSFDITGASCVIDRPYDITTDFGSLHIVQGVAMTVPAGHIIKAKEEGSVSEVLEYDVPKYLAAVNRIYLKPQAQGDKGAAVRLTLKLNDIAAINGGGNITLALVADDDYELYDKDGNSLQEIDHQGHTTTYQISNKQEFAAGTNQIDFTVFLASVANKESVVNNKLTIPINFGYHISFDITSRANTLTVNTLPELHIDTTLQYHDADIVLNEVSLLEHGSIAENASSITINNLPEQIKSIRRVNFSDHSPIHLLAEGLDWLDDTMAEHIVIEAQLPDYLTLHNEQQSGYDAATHTLRTNLNNLRHKIDINLDSLDFAGDGLVPQNGAISIDFLPDIAAYIEAGTEVKLSTILHEKQIKFSAGFDNSTLELVSIEGLVEYKHKEQTTIELGDLDEDISLTISNAGLQPVITLNVENPLTLAAKLSAKLTPIANGVANLDNIVSINDVEITAATVENGVVKSTPTTLILAEESLRSNYTDSKYTFVACDLTKLFTGQFPDKIDFDFEVATDQNSTQTIYVTESYTLVYDYNVHIPLAFNNNLDLTIEKLATNLQSTFEDVADWDITLGDVTVIADVVNTIPLDFEAEAEALNAEGKPADISLICVAPNNTLKGSADGVSEAKSELRLTLKFGKTGNINKLAEVDAIRFKLRAKRSQSGSVALNTEQYIALKLKLEVKGQINADLGNF